MPKLVIQILMMKVIRLRPKAIAKQLTEQHNYSQVDQILFQLLYKNMESIDQKLTQIIDPKGTKK